MLLNKNTKYSGVYIKTMFERHDTLLIPDMHLQKNDFKSLDEEFQYVMDLAYRCPFCVKRNQIKHKIFFKRFMLNTCHVISVTCPHCYHTYSIYFLWNLTKEEKRAFKKKVGEMNES